jgi:hypothetical protein
MTSASQAAPASIFKYEIIRQISPGEIWHSNQKSIQGTGATILYLGFDRESVGAEEKGGWVSQGIILGGLGDLDSNPTAVRLWSKKPAHLNSTVSRALSGKRASAVAVFDLDGSLCSQTDECLSSRIIFSVTDDGKMLAGNKVIGMAP